MIYIIPETNFLRIPYNKEHTDYTVFHFNGNLKKLYDLKEANNSKDSISIVLPEIVCRELQQQKLDAYQEDCRKWEKLCNSFGDYANGVIHVSVDEFNRRLNKQIQMRIDEFNLPIMPICKSVWFKSIIERAIDKTPPFEGKEKESDKGFKDTVLWYSILEFAREKNGEYIFITNDNIFHNHIKAFKDEFYRATGNNIFICRTYEDVLQYVVVNEADKYIDSVSINDETREIVLKHSNTDYSAKLNYLQPKVFAEEDVLTFINQDIKKIYDNALSYWDGIDLERLHGDVEYIGHMEYEVLYNQDGILSLIFNGEIYLGGAHGTPSKTGKVYDLSTGKVLGLCHLLGESEGKVLHRLKERWKIDKEKRGDDVYWDNFKPNYKSVEEIKFYLDKKGIHIFFDVDEAACYAEGFVEFILADISELAIMKRKKG